MIMIMIMIMIIIAWAAQTYWGFYWRLCLCEGAVILIQYVCACVNVIMLWGEWLNSGRHRS